MRRVLVLTDQSFVIQVVRAAIQRVAGLHLVGVAPGCMSAIPALRRLDPDIVLIDDAGTPDLTLTRVREAVVSAPRAKCVILATAMDESALRPSFDAGADAAIARRVDTGTLGRLLRDVVEERVMQRPRWYRDHGDVPAQCPLTARELEILRLVAEGRRNAWIAAALSVTEQTVKFHLSNIYRKLGVVNRTEASRYAHAHRLVERSPDRLVS